MNTKIINNVKHACLVYLTGKLDRRSLSHFYKITTELCEVSLGKAIDFIDSQVNLNYGPDDFEPRVLRVNPKSIEVYLLNKENQEKSVKFFLKVKADSALEREDLCACKAYISEKRSAKIELNRNMIGQRARALKFLQENELCKDKSLLDNETYLYLKTVQLEQEIAILKQRYE